MVADNHLSLQFQSLLGQQAQRQCTDTQAGKHTYNIKINTSN